jgi:hypothetical protein
MPHSIAAIIVFDLAGAALIGSAGRLIVFTHLSVP